jgi:hypothetical protein
MPVCQVGERFSQVVEILVALEEPGSLDGAHTHILRRTRGRCKGSPGLELELESSPKHSSPMEGREANREPDRTPAPGNSIRQSAGLRVANEVFVPRSAGLQRNV